MKKNESNKNLNNIKNQSNVLFKNNNQNQELIRLIKAYWPVVVVALGAGIWLGTLSTRVSTIKDSLSSLKNTIENNTNRIDSLFSSNYVPETKIKPVNVQSSCRIGLIDSKTTTGKKSSFGFSYFLDHAIAEANISSSRWNSDFNRIPYAGDFIEITNSRTGLSTWAMVIGDFRDENNPNRLLIVSETVSKALDFPLGMGVLDAKIRFIQDSEWKRDRLKVELREFYGL